MAGGDTILNRRKGITEDTFKGLGFKRQELTDFFFSKGKTFNFGLPPMRFDDEGFESQQKNASIPTQNLSEDNHSTITHDSSNCVQWEPRFEGRKAALEIIGAISKILVEKSGNKYQHGENVSASAIANCVADMIDKSPDNYRKLIGEALKMSGLAKE